MPAAIDPWQNQPTMRGMPEDRLSRSSAARGIEHVILGLRKDVIEMNLPEYMHPSGNEFPHRPNRDDVPCVVHYDQ